MKTLLASANDKNNLEQLINEFYCSENYIITKDNKVFNIKTGKTFSSVVVKIKRNRWQFGIAK